MKTEVKNQIKTACGWMADVELPLIAERILSHCVERIEELEAELKSPARTMQKYYRNLWQTAEAQLERVLLAVGTHACCGRDCIGIHAEHDSATQFRCSSCMGVQQALENDGER